MLEDILIRYQELVVKYNVPISVDDEQDMKYTATKKYKIVLSSDMTLEEILQSMYYTLRLVIPTHDSPMSLAEIIEGQINIEKEIKQAMEEDNSDQ